MRLIVWGMSELDDKRHERVLRTESAAANVIRQWLTGEVYVGPDRETQRRRPYRKTTAKRVKRAA